MDLARLSAIALPDQHGEVHRLGDLWSDRPAVVVFLRHFGCHNCRDHAVQLRDSTTSCRRRVSSWSRSAPVTRYAGTFVHDEAIPYLVLVDDDAGRHARPRSTSRRGIASCTVELGGDARNLEAGRPHPAGRQARHPARRDVRIGPGDRVRTATSTPTALTTHRFPTSLLRSAPDGAA